MCGFSTNRNQKHFQSTFRKNLNDFEPTFIHRVKAHTVQSIILFWQWFVFCLLEKKKRIWEASNKPSERRSNIKSFSKKIFELSEMVSESIRKKWSVFLICRRLVVLLSLGRHAKHFFFIIIWLLLLLPLPLPTTPTMMLFYYHRCSCCCCCCIHRFYWCCRHWGTIFGLNSSKNLILRSGTIFLSSLEPHRTHFLTLTFQMRKLKWEYSAENIVWSVSQTKIWIIHILLSILSTFFSHFILRIQLLLFRHVCCWYIFSVQFLFVFVRFSVYVFFFVQLYDF